MKYSPRPHAVDRALIRFGIPSDQAKCWFNQLLETARFIGEHNKKQIFDHKGKRIITEGNEIVTIIKAVDLPFAGKISRMVERELNKAKKELDKKERELSIEIAELTVEQATLNLNRLKAKSPTVKKSIADKLAKVNERINELKVVLEREKDDFKHLAINSSGYLINEMEVAN